jgi:type IV pilus assembly protein PilB
VVRQKLGDALVMAGSLSEEQLRAALVEHERTRLRLGDVLVRMNLASEQSVSRVLAAQLGFDYVELGEITPDPVAMASVPEAIASAFGCVGVRRSGNTLTVAMSAPFEFSVVTRIEEVSGCHVRQVLASRMDILDAIARAYPVMSAGSESSIGSNGARGDAGADVPSDETPPSTQNLEDVGSGVVDFIVRAAIEKRASEIHVASIDNDVVVRYRGESGLSETMPLPHGARAALVDRLKLMAGLQVEEQRLPQTGRIRVAVDGVNLDLRLSTVRAPAGEKLVLRLAYPPMPVPGLEELGLSSAALTRLRGLLAKRHGVILVAGPRGSGRTTTLGSIAAALSTGSRADRARAIPGPTSLTAVPPQHPEAVLLDDVEQEQIPSLLANAGRGGPLFVGVVEADDGAAAVARLSELGVPSTTIATALVGVVAQRLVRRLCERCRYPFEPSAGVLEALNVAPGEQGEFYGTVGCDACDYSGFRGSVALFEVVEVDGVLRPVIAESASAAEIRRAVRAGGTANLADEGLAAVKAGITTANELLRHVQITNAPRPLCTRCGVGLENDFVACPRCGTRRHTPCGRCGRALQCDWRVCPYCELVVPAEG